MPHRACSWWTRRSSAREALNQIKQETALDWTFLSPAVHLEPGERRGSYRLGLESPVMDEQGPAHISVADLAVAIVDELEQPAHVQQRFTVGY